MRILIADDEGPARARLRALLDDADKGYRVVGEAANGREVLEFCAQQPVDLVLLDIRMPGIDGLAAAEQLARQSHPPAVIFTTAYEEHALKAFEAQAIDYLLKPIRSDRLRQSIARAQTLNKAQLEGLRSRESAALSVTLRGVTERIPLEQIRYLHADNKYVEVGYAGGEALIEESLKSLEERFQGQFLRIHRATLIAPRYLRSLGKSSDGQTWVQLQGSERRLVVSRRHLSSLRARLKNEG